MTASTHRPAIPPPPKSAPSGGPQSPPAGHPAGRPEGPEGTTAVAGKRWYRPGTWHLGTRLIAVTMALLTVICVLVGMVCYTAMNLSLRDQLDSQLSQASHRANVFTTEPPPDVTGGRPDPLNARGTGTGQLNAVIINGTIVAAGMLSPSGARQTLTRADLVTLAALPVTGQPQDGALSIGPYRVQSVATPTGAIVITGLPLGPTEQTLATLVLTIVLVSLAGLLAVGLLGTVIIRRTMKPLEQLSGVATNVAHLPLDAGEVALAVRVPPSASNPGTEVGNVGHALNGMLDNVAHALQARQRSETKVRRFVADASHELRTPLTAIRGYTELLQMTEQLSDEGQTSLSRVKEQSLRMGALIEDLLLLARLDEGHSPSLERIDAVQLVVEAASDIRVAAPDHRWTLEVPDEPVEVNADVSQLRQVVLNLLSNAHKHTDPGTLVVVGVARGHQGDAVITVTDNGPGIDPAFQQVVFDRFARADAARSGTAGTTGLGLGIAEAIVTAHHGTIELESRPGRTRFTIHLPAA
ncbi:sensor histidine kinase [Specibacter cremeus]|uniref:sensor histidine kinase n=1 Tax=Specibacter cremeus TaxID=1629051 RepID=UPI000F7B162E|nr:HAMP domain-containing sensor histidine kinase [Specibacter cremeus]